MSSLIRRAFYIKTLSGDTLGIVEQPEPETVALNINDQWCTISREAWQALHILSQNYSSYSDYVRFVSPEPPLAEHPVEPPVEPPTI